MSERQTDRQKKKREKWRRKDWGRQRERVTGMREKERVRRKLRQRDKWDDEER